MRFFAMLVACSVALPVCSVPPSVAAPVAAGVANWGEDTLGQLGDGLWTTSAEPAFPLSSLGSVSAVSAGWGHACAIVDAVVYCWGRNDWGQLGDGTRTNSNVPQKVLGLDGKSVTDVAAGGAHTCAIADNLAYCWGPEDAYRLGTGASTSMVFTTAQPVSTTGVLAGKTATDISAGFEHTCEVASGKAYCWGWAGDGRLGNGQTSGAYDIAAVDASGVLSGKTVTAVEAGGSQTCAIADARLYCWGDGGAGALGNGVFGGSAVPVAVAGTLSNKTVSAVSVSTRQSWDTSGGSHVCAIADANAYCWGEGSDGQLGNGQNADAAVPMAVSTSSDLGNGTVTSIAAGGRHSCAVSGGRVSCWGSAEKKQLGIASASNTPKAVFSDPASVAQISAGATFSMARLDAGAKPGTVGDLLARGDWRQVALSWNPPADAGSPAGTRYEVDVMSGGSWHRHTTTTARSLLFGNLQPGDTVHARVRLRNGYGIGPWSEASGSADPTVRPDAVRDAVAVPEAGQVTFRWNPPGNAAAAHVQGYDVSVRVENPCNDVPSHDWEYDPDLPECTIAATLSPDNRELAVNKLQDYQRVYAEITPSGRDGDGPTTSLQGQAPTWVDTGRGDVSLSIDSSKSHRGAGVLVKAKGWDIYARGSQTKRGSAACEDVTVAFTATGSTDSKRYPKFCDAGVLDPPKAGLFTVTYRGVQKQVGVQVVQGTGQYRLVNAKQTSGSVEKGTPIVRTNMYVERKFRDGKWVRIEQRPWIEFRADGAKKWRRVPNKATRPGWYRVANHAVFWRPTKITKVRVPTPRADPKNPPPYDSDAEYDKAMVLIKEIWWRPGYEDVRSRWCAYYNGYDGAGDSQTVWKAMRGDFKDAGIRLEPAHTALSIFLQNECHLPEYYGIPVPW